MTTRALFYHICLHWWCSYMVMMLLAVVFMFKPIDWMSAEFQRVFRKLSWQIFHSQSPGICLIPLEQTQSSSLAQLILRSAFHVTLDRTPIYLLTFPCSPACTSPTLSLNIPWAPRKLCPSTETLDNRKLYRRIIRPFPEQ